MKICFLIDDYSAIGGIQRVVPLISSALCDYHDVHVVSMYDEHEDNNLDLYDKRIKLTTLIDGKKEYIKQAFKIVKLLKEYLRQNNIDILIETSEMLSPYSFLACKALHIPYIMWTHSTAFRYNEAKTQRPFKYLGIKTSAYTVALTETIKKQLIGKYKVNHIINIPNPIDEKLMGDVNYDLTSKKIISVGRICYEKYYEKLIEVASIVLKNNLDWTWDIYGDGKDRNVLEELIKENNLVNRLNLKGNVNNLYELYDDYGILVMASRSEAFPMALLEGTAKGLPMVAFDIPSVREIIENDGILIETFDEKKMAAAIDELIHNEHKRKELSNCCINNRDNYSLKKIIDKWNGLFECLKK